MTFCEAWSLVKSEPTKKTITPLRCRSWRCDECAPRRKAQLIAQAFAGRPDNFLTLTCNTEIFPTPEHGARELANAWRILRKRAIREAQRDPAKKPLPFGARHDWSKEKDAHGRVAPQVKTIRKTIPFLAVFEQTKKGWPHLHIVLRCPWLSQKWTSIQMADIIGSPIVWIERVAQDGRIATYISKYVGKESHRFNTCKRYWSSRDWEAPDATNDDDDEDAFFAFEIVQQGMQTILDDYRARGWWSKWEKDHYVLSWQPFTGADPPPEKKARPQRNSDGWFWT